MTDPQTTDHDTSPAGGPMRRSLGGSEPSTPAELQHELQSLAPSYTAEHHDTYVDHLTRVVIDVKNKNVALAGRYGIGKSSVLDRFQEEHEGKVLRVSITTLGPDRDGEGLTNRIQKELVKQLIYRTEPSELRSSRFARTDPISPGKALRQGAVATAVLGLFLGLGGWLPDVATFPGDLTGSWGSVGAVVMFVLAWALYYGTATAIASWLRLVLDSRIVTSLSTAGTSITLGERDDTYFDAYLDELVTYFDRGGEDFVIFEDLDRFDDPAIFDSLRELNTILNSSPRRIAAASGRQLCFIYAIKDSLFERLAQPEQDSDPQQDADVQKTATDDLAGDQRSASAQLGSKDNARALRESLAERANRTKFFDVVIPMVPFLSHRNARDVLEKALAQRNIPAETLSRALLSLVARHATDMRLLLNILNEFTVYAQRLLWVSNSAPGLTGNRLFALVVYKNFHLADFEDIPVRKSALDELDRAHRDLVRHAVSSRQRDRRQARDSVLTEARQSELANRLGQALVGAARALLHTSSFRKVAQFRVGGEIFPLAAAYTIGFWQTVVQNQSIYVDPFNGEQPYPGGAKELDQTMLQDWFPDAFAQNVWSKEQTAATGRRIEKLTEQLDFLPGAGYTDLLERTEFVDVQGRTFPELLEAHLTSDIARELVRKGYINRNFATYSAAFYGTFAGIDAETFYYRAVQPNEILLDHRFDTDDSLRNLLDQLDEDEPEFYRTVSALNPQIVTYLIEHRHERAREVAGFLSTHFDDNAREFMTTYLAEDHAPHASLIGILAAQGWRGLFDYLASEEVPDTLRLGLVDAALTNATAVGDFVLGQDIRSYIADHYTEMGAFTDERSEQQAKVIKDFASNCGVQVEKLASVPEPLRKLLVESQMYVLTADNLRTAAGVEGSVSLDVLAANEVVNIHCLANIDAYLQVIDGDPATPHAVEKPQTLLALLGEDHEWSASQLSSLLDRSDSNSAIEDLAQVPQSGWRLLAKKHRFALTVPNLTHYIEQHGVDAELASHLTADGAAIQTQSKTEPNDTDDSEETDGASKTPLALELLNAHEQLRAADRAALAAQLNVRPSDLTLAEVRPAPDDLLAEALDRGLLQVSEEAFTHFATAGWVAVSGALVRHSELQQFVTAPRMSDGLTQGLLEDDEAPAELHDRVFDDFDTFIAVTSAEPGLYRAVARRAVQRGEKLSIEHIARIANHAPDQNTVVELLAAHQGIDGDQLVAILRLLGPPYDKLSTAGEEDDVPAGDAAGTLFNRLVATDKVKLVKRKTRFQVL